jgi:predicted HicB family RNase H-like nuclease
MMEVAEGTRFEDRVHKVRATLQERPNGQTDWVSFYREILGVGGLLDELFGTGEQRQQFERTEDYAMIQQTVAKLREKSKVARDNGDESTRVITVRLPESLHEALLSEAYHHQTSMNQLCISKLLQVIAGELVPSDLKRRNNERAARTRSTRRAAAEQNQQNQQPEVHPVELTEEIQPNPLAVGGVPRSHSFTDSMTGGRPF